MAAQLKAIRRAVADRLRGRTMAGERVSTNRPDQVWKLATPAIVIHTQDDESDLDQTGPPEYTRRARVLIELLLEDARSGFPPDDQLDDFAEEVEQLLYVDPRLGGAAREGRQLSWAMRVADGGEVLVGGGTLTWEFMYYTEAREGDPGAIADLLAAHTYYNATP